MGANNFIPEDSIEIGKRAGLLEEFINSVFDEEDRPYFVSDKATLYDLTCGDEKEIISRIERTFGISIMEEHFKLPVWELLDFISSKAKGLS